ncbi:DUF3572 family protein [Sphingomonas sp. RS2018]
MPARDTNDETMALHALAWTLSDEARAGRLIDTTGLDPDDLRARAADPAILVAVLTFLEAHEPDLIAAAEGVGTTPAALVTLRERLERA